MADTGFDPTRLGSADPGPFFHGTKSRVEVGDHLVPGFGSNFQEGRVANNIYFANNFSDSEPQLTEVRNAYRAKFGEDPINKAYLGYDKITTILKAIDLGGGASGPQIIAGLSKVKDVQGTTGIITLSPKTHQPVGLSMVMYKIENGKYKEIGRYVPESHK